MEWHGKYGGGSMKRSLVSVTMKKRRKTVTPFDVGNGF